MSETPATPPGWYPDPKMAGTNRYWDGEQWTEHVAPTPTPVAPASSGGPGVWTIAAGILVAVIVVFLAYSFVHADDAVDCATDNADRALNGQPSRDCG